METIEQAVELLAQEGWFAPVIALAAVSLVAGIVKKAVHFIVIAVALAAVAVYMGWIVV